MKLIVLVPLLLMTGCASMRANVVGGKARSFDGTEIVYDARGRGEPALVFVHGWCCNRTQWAHQMDAFAADHRVVAIDLGGHGESGRQRLKWTVPDYAYDVEAVVDAQRLDRVILVGHSMGGPVAMMAAARMPDRVIGVIGVDTLHDVNRTLTKEMMAPFIQAMADDFHTSVAGFIEQIHTANPDVDPALVERLIADAQANETRMAVELMTSFTEFDPKAVMTACPAPIRCINAAASPWPTNIEGNRQCADFDAVLIDGVGHWPMLERPVEFNRLMREQVASLEEAG